MLLYGIDVHIVFSPTINSPGFENEQKTKPEITKKIEEGDTPLSCEEAAQTLLNGQSAEDALNIVLHIYRDYRY